MKKVSFITLGCRVNQYETQAVREELLRNGFTEAKSGEKSDLYLINTCAVTGESERKSRQMIRRVLRHKKEDPNVVVCACGCYVQGAENEAFLSSVDVLCGNDGKGKLAGILSELCGVPYEKRVPVDLRGEIASVRKYEPLQVCRSHNVRAFVKIEDGCNSFCSYCYVPLVRGRVRSRHAEEIRAEVERLANNGYREIVLTGIETGAWGQDFEGKETLVSLLQSVHETKGLERIRFGSLKPSLFTDSFCRALSEFPKVMPHFHLSLQSGSSNVLKRMGRNYGREEEEAAVNAIYRYFPDAGLSADLICGFPGESESDFSESLSLVETARLLHTHIFPYSPRKGTRAALEKETVSEEEKRLRCSVLLDKAKESSLNFAKEREGREYRVLCEKVQNGAMLGYTENFLHTRITGNVPWIPGEIYSVTLGTETEFSVENLTVSGKSKK